MIIGKNIIDKIEEYAPLSLRMHNDPTGLQIGNASNNVHKVLTTLDVRPEVVEEAVNNDVDFIFAHHPVMFHPAHNLDTSNPQNQMYADILNHNITVYAAHTNMDKAKNGMNDWLAEAMELSEISEFGYDQDGIAIGRIGELPDEISINHLAVNLKRKFNLQGLRVISKNDHQKIQRVAVVGGDGGKFYLQAKNAGADIYITGDVYYHTAHDMLAYNLPVIDPGHHIESIFKSQTEQLLKKWSSENSWNIDIISSKLNTDPFTFF